MAEGAADMMMNYSNLKDAAISGGGVVNESKPYLAATSCSESVEIEGRLGRWTEQGTFSSDIGNSAFCTILHLLETFPRWSKVEDWEESQDVFYTLALPVAGAEPTKMQVRTSVSSRDGKHSVSHIVKRRIRSADFSLQSMDQGSCALGTDTGKLINDISARLCASLEKVLPPEVLPVAVTPDFVRIKERKRFLLPSLGIDGNCFAFETTIVFTGKSKSEAEKNQKNNIAPSFEIEIECLAPRAYLGMCADEGSCLALSILVKLLDFASHLNHSMHVTFVPRGVTSISLNGGGSTAPGAACLHNSHIGAAFV